MGKELISIGKEIIFKTDENIFKIYRIESKN